VELQSRYSRAGGGRTAEVPVGDLLNPVYSTLNQFLSSGPFPTNLENEQIVFLREKEHDTRIRMTQPIFNLRVHHNHRLKAQKAGMRESEFRALRRELVRDIKSAYYGYLKALEASEIYASALELLSESRRVTQKLLEADKVTRDAVYRADTELHRVTEEGRSARNRAELAGSYLNFLLNRPLDSDIVRSSAPSDLQPPTKPLQELKQAALTGREELQQLEAAIGMARHAKGIARSGTLPSLALVADYGLQGESYRLSKDDDYWMVSGVLKWNLFSGTSDRARVAGARLEIQKLDAALEEARRRVELQVEQSYQNANSAHERLKPARLASRSAGEAFRMVARKYDHGMASQIEYLDARTTLTATRTAEVIARYDYLTHLAELESASGTYDFGSTENGDRR
ncbi:MAG: TolC family protein, partial [Candidatus Latescibacteria bacterium]|nr:TolC family protein [Candidatus Latescibacterota bacterium]